MSSVWIREVEELRVLPSLFDAIAAKEYVRDLCSMDASPFALSCELCER